MNRRYIVVTPCRNEETNLPNLVQSIIAQTIGPALWVIVDDSSTDKTPEILAEVEITYEWVKGVHLTEHKDYLGVQYAAVCNNGFEYAEGYCDEKGIPYEYIALVDADNILEARYFEKLINEFEKDEKLGLASGNSAYADIETILDNLKIKDPDATVMDAEFWQMWDSNTTQIQNIRDDLTMGSARLWRKDCFEETDSYLPVPLPDSASIAMAKLKGWRTRRFRHIRVIERGCLEKKGLWKGYKEWGKFYFILGQSFLLTMAKSLYYTFTKPHYIGIAYFYGYAMSYIRREKKVNGEIGHYYRSIRTRELKVYYKQKLKKLIGK